MQHLIGKKLSRKSKWNGDCLEYHGAFNDKSQGKRCVRYNGKSQLAHRVAFNEAFGYFPKQVNHHCHNASCINPNHLYSGDQTDNMQDMAWAGRHPLWSTNWERVAEVKRLRSQGLSQRAVGARLEITQSAVSKLEKKYG